MCNFLEASFAELDRLTYAQLSLVPHEEVGDVLHFAE
jgi:hypothetical protein